MITVSMHVHSDNSAQAYNGNSVHVHNDKSALSLTKSIVLLKKNVDTVSLHKRTQSSLLHKNREIYE